MNEQTKEYGLMLDIHQAINFSGLPKAQLYRLAREEEDFPVLRLGGRVFFNRDGLIQWLQDNTGNRTMCL
jgi:predicted DNA-binding transcriptional regulator AlpA